MSYTADDSALWLARCAQRAQYGEPPHVNVWYLDTDPVLAAQDHCDAHVREAPRRYAQLLGDAWHALAPEAIEFEWTNTDPRVVGHIDDRPGGYYYLGGQRIYREEFEGSPLATWVRESADNYAWLWRCAMTLAAQHRVRFRSPSRAEPVLWTLECPPTALAATGPTQPTPQVPEPFRVSSGEFYDTVASYRLAYVGLFQRMLRWTRWRTPAWLRPVHGGLFDLR